MAGTGNLNALAHQPIEIQWKTLAHTLVSGFAGFQHLLHRSQQPVGVVEHDAVEGASLRLINIAALQGLEIETNGGQRGFQLVSDGVDKAIVLLVAANLAHQKAGIENKSGGDRTKKDHAQQDAYTGLPVQDDPAECDRDNNRG